MTYERELSKAKTVKINTQKYEKIYNFSSAQFDHNAVQAPPREGTPQQLNLYIQRYRLNFSWNCTLNELTGTVHGRQC